MPWNPWVFLASVAMFFALMAWMIYWIYRTKLLEREERRLMIERGVTLPTPPPQGWPGVRARELELRHAEQRLRIEQGLDVPLEQPRTKGPDDYLRRGLISLCLGLGLGIGFLAIRSSGLEIYHDTEAWLAALAVASPVCTLFGAAHLAYYRATRHRSSETGRSTPVSG